MNAFATLHFLRPSALLLLLALPLCWYAWRHGRTDAGAWRAVVDAHLLPHLIERIDGGSGRGGLVLAAILWTLACIALAGPAWEREPMPLYRNQAARVLALELAPSMLAQDVKPSRLERARYKIDDILARSRDYQTALLGYAGDAFVAAPLTDDVETVKNLVESLDPSTMPVPGNATARAIESAADLIDQAGLHRGEIIVLADSASRDAASAARKAHARGFEVSVLGFGTDAGAPVALAQGDFLKDDAGNLVVSRLDEPALRAVAAAGGGRYATLGADAGDIDSLLSTRADIGARDARDVDADVDSARWKDRGPWLVLALLPLALAGFRRGWLMTLLLAAAFPRADAQAASLQDLWRRPDQQAAAALAAGDAKGAAEVAPTAEWRGSAAYRGGDFAAAESAYAHATGADAAYNRGNALAKLGRYEEAIAAYDEALKQAPAMDDALANRKAVEDFMKQRKQQDPQNQQGQQNPQQQGQQGESKDQSKEGAQDQQQQSSQKQTQDGENGQGKPDDASKDAQDKDAGKPDDKPDDKDGARKDAATGDNANAQDGKSSGKPDAAQQQALKRDVDRALAGKQGKPDDRDGKPAAMQEPEDDATREKRQALEHWLERVPDDPGGLLRRKFQLEYQRRQQRGGEGG
jgi:Ca-activated chloride channel family protein